MPLYKGCLQDRLVNKLISAKSLEEAINKSKEKFQLLNDLPAQVKIKYEFIK